MRTFSCSLFMVTFLAAGAATGAAQSLGTFRWQLQPYCNILTVAVTQVGGVYRIEGTDDQCGAGPSLASVQGIAYLNPSGTVGLGLSLVTAPGGAPVHIDANVLLTTLSGSWRDSTGGAGPFTFTPEAGRGGVPRPPRAVSVPAAIHLMEDGGFVAGGTLNSGIVPATGSGTRMMWYPGKAAFRTGSVDFEWEDNVVGSYSVALGSNTRAAGGGSVAAGLFATALGQGATALGRSARASGTASVAMGNDALADEYAVAMGGAARATGTYTTAISGGAAGGRAGTGLAGGAARGDFGATAGFAAGTGATASGDKSVALGGGVFAGGSVSLATGIGTLSAGRASFAAGRSSVANGDDSVAIGTKAETSPTGDGSFVFADASSSEFFTSAAFNEFRARFAGGFYFYTSATLASGVALAAGGSSWAALSDANAKENFTEVDGEDLLARLAGVPIRTWNYKAQGRASRHIGPTAQDFRAAFGLGDFPLRINTIDADGVALAGVKAIDARTSSLGADVDTIAEDATKLRLSYAELRARLARLEAASQKE